MALPRSRREFKDWCLREVGFPVLELEIDDQQVDDKIDYALSYYMDYHFGGIELVYLKHQITQDNKDTGYVELSDLIQGVNRIWDVGSLIASNNMFSYQYQFALNDLFALTSTSLIPYTTAVRHVALVSEYFSGRPGIQFNRNSNKLYVTGQQALRVGEFLVIECYRALDPDVHNDIWKDKWLLRYTSAQIKKQIGEHLMKMNITLTGGVTYNGEKIFELAKEEIDELEREMQSSLSWPVMDQIG